LLSGSAVTFAGTHYSVSGLDTFPEPAQRPRPPILVAQAAGGCSGSEERGRHRRHPAQGAAGRNDLDDLAERTPETVARKVEWVREAAEARFDEIELSMVISPDITDDHTGAAERYAAEHGWGIAAAERVLEMPYLVGPVARIVDDMLARREQYGFSYYVVSDQDLGAFGSVVEHLAGR
jgi:alkanesulfonate monooxygenase SsuD/methylene tetrahydromethanopterin reductase-like flavin-dependent oxidoreductase (luciferase family)